MILVFIFCGIVILITFAIFLVSFSTIRLKIKNFEISNIEYDTNKEDSKFKNKSKYKVEVSLYFLGKIKWIATSLNDKKMQKMYSKVQLEQIDVKKIKQDLGLEKVKEIKKIKPQINLLDLKIKLGTENAIFTSFLVFLVSTFISIILPYTIKKYEENKYSYEIKPIYANKNVYEIKFDCIFELKMVHIINIIYIFVKRRRVDKNERSSNRRAYGYSYE